MAYATTTQLQERLGLSIYARLTDRENGAVANHSVAAQILAEAEGRVNSFLARRYATPIDLFAHPELAAVLAMRTLDVAESLAWRGSPFTTDMPERVRVVGDEAERWLSALARGELELPANGPPASRTSRVDSPQYRASRRRFTHDELDGL